MPAFAQCPDGTPPPCAARAQVVRAAPPPPAERGRRFLVLPFRNLTRAPDADWLVDGSPTMLADALARWQDVRVVPDEQLYPALRRHNLAPGTVMELPRVRRVAEETGGWTAVVGDVLASAGRLRVSARAYDVVTNRELVRASQDVPPGGDIRAAFERIATALLRTAGLDTAGVDLGGATTRSLEAYRAYLRGRALFRQARFRRAIAPLEEAVARDSTFAQAHTLLAEALMFIRPLSLFEPGGATQRAMARATALAPRLPARQRDYVLSLNGIFQGRFAAARRALEALVAADSNDIESVSLLSFLEYVDPILVPAGRGERPRGSPNRNIRLARRVIDLDPGAHGAFMPIVYQYALAAGALPGVVAGFRREEASLDALFRQTPRIFIPLLSDSIELAPAESLAAWSPDSLAAARRRAREAARAWVDRWLAVGPDEGEAHLAAALVLELEGHWARALVELATAESLGVESGVTDAPSRRLALLGKLGRYREAAREGERQWTTGRFRSVFAAPGDQIEALAWTFNLALWSGAFARADSALVTMATSLMRSGIPDTATGLAYAVPMLSGSGLPPVWNITLPAPFRAEVMDSVFAHRDRVPAGGPSDRGLPTLARLASRAWDADSALSRRPPPPWYRARDPR